jgi:hypothetical protein
MARLCQKLLAVEVPERLISGADPSADPFTTEATKSNPLPKTATDTLKC